MFGKCHNMLILGVSMDVPIITSQTYVTSALMSSFISVCSPDRYNPAFRWIKDNVRRPPLNFASCGEEPYNAAFTLSELLILDQPHNTSQCLNDINNKMLSLTSCQLKAFVFPCTIIYRRTLSSLSFWREAVVISVPKPGKDYPLIVCVHKSMDCTFNHEFIWILEN